MSAIIQEYTYENETQHLDDGEALEKYQHEKALHPNAVIVLDDLDCGHWEVRVYETPHEKEKFMREKLAKLWDSFYSAFKK